MLGLEMGREVALLFSSHRTSGYIARVFGKLCCGWQTSGGVVSCCLFPSASSRGDIVRHNGLLYSPGDDARARSGDFGGGIGLPVALSGDLRRREAFATLALASAQSTGAGHFDSWLAGQAGQV